MSQDPNEDPVEALRKLANAEIIAGQLNNTPTSIDNSAEAAKATVKLAKADKDKPEIAFASKIAMQSAFMVEKYRSLLKGSTHSGLLTQSMIYAYQKGIQDVIKLLLKGEDEKPNQQVQKEG
jgi:hypothetical protein